MRGGRGQRHPLSKGFWEETEFAPQAGAFHPHAFVALACGPLASLPGDRMTEASQIWPVSSLQLPCPDPAATALVTPQFGGSSCDSTLATSLAIPKHLLRAGFGPAALSALCSLCPGRCLHVWPRSRHRAGAHGSEWRAGGQAEGHRAGDLRLRAAGASEAPAQASPRCFVLIRS